MDTPPTSHADLTDLASRLQAACLAHGQTVATAESCTGGLVAHAITAIPGASGYFLGSVVSYSDAVKRDLLDVPAELIRTHGAVSAQVALAMAAGARSRVGSDLGVGITGVAGPDGGTDEKPVGLVYVAVADAEGAEVRRYLWTRDRTGNIVESAAAALRALVERAERPSEVASR